MEVGFDVNLSEMEACSYGKVDCAIVYEKHKVIEYMYVDYRPTCSLVHTRKDYI